MIARTIRPARNAEQESCSGSGGPGGGYSDGPRTRRQASHPRHLSFVETSGPGASRRAARRARRGLDLPLPGTQRAAAFCRLRAGLRRTRARRPELAPVRRPWNA
ncbi:hypothetical protein HBB16_17050 [Pseudonocardia sp. MCCB 268]|nr:hypothetical protein [Pseudonocardia cytotoxica]